MHTRNVVHTAYLRPSPPKSRWVLVYCPSCEHWISDESRHQCELDAKERELRAVLRHAKLLEAGLRDYD